MPRDALTLADALAQDTDDDFCNALLEATPNFDGLPFHERPDAVGMLGGLATLYSDVTNEGIWKFLAQHEGDGFAETHAWCAKIGAKGAVAYLDAAAALFPDGKVSRDGSKRDRILERLERRKGGDPLRALDKTHAKAMAAMATALRKYVKKRRAPLQTACDAKPDKPVATEIEMMERALGELQRFVAKSEARQLELKTKAKARGIRPLNGKEDPRMTAFFAALSALSVKDWTEIAQRGIKSAAKIKWGESRAFDVSSDLGRGNIIPVATHDRSVHKPAMKARDRFFKETVEKLPVKAGRGADAIQLRLTVERMIIPATVVLMVYDWLMATQQGPKAVENVMAPFRGFAPLLE